MIKLDEIVVSDNSCKFNYLVSSKLIKYFTGKDFTINYDENICSVPKSILAIPFVCNVLPLVWLSDSTLFLEELDKDFYHSIKKFKKGYTVMFPDAAFKGNIKVEKLVDNKISHSDNSLMFFSGGLDSIYTLIRHYKENPVLFSIWGSDIFPEESNGWEILNNQLAETADNFSLKKCTAKSSFRMFDNEVTLSNDFDDVLHDNWWHAVQHGIGLISHAAPIAWLHKINKVYIASTNCPEDGHVSCASHPTIDNKISFFGCSVIHDGFNANRQDKSESFVEFCNKSGKPLKLHVCYETQDGNNCSNCEKCLRTIFGIIAEKDDANKYGFSNFSKAIRYSKFTMSDVFSNDRVGIVTRQWANIQKRMIQNRDYVKQLSEWKYIKWLLDHDFNKPNIVNFTFYDKFVLRWSYIKRCVLESLTKLGLRH